MQQQKKVEDFLNFHYVAFSLFFFLTLETHFLMISISCK